MKVNNLSCSVHSTLYGQQYGWEVLEQETASKMPTFLLLWIYYDDEYDGDAMHKLYTYQLHRLKGIHNADLGKFILTKSKYNLADFVSAE